MSRDKSEENGAELVSAASALIAMRNSDFDELSAYGEVIDNSIQAEASFVKIKLENDGRNILSLAFVDDGIGMDTHTLGHCLSMGWSSRFNDRSGIGRFGVGMKLGAIHQCKRISVWSKQIDGEWLYTYLDIDEVASYEMKRIPVAIEQKPPEHLLKMSNSKNGTIVLWEKYDKLEKKLGTLLNQLPMWLGRTFRYFIWNRDHKDELIRSKPLKIILNDELIYAYDPLHYRKELTRFPNDEESTIYEPMAIQWPVDKQDMKVDIIIPEYSEIIIRFSLTPEEWRPTEGTGGLNTNKHRGINGDSEGISILRNNREVYWGTIPHWNRVNRGKGWSAFLAKDRWWGCEIIFDAVLDRSFAVKNIKRGAIPLPELLSTIKATLLPSRNSAIEAVTDVWKLADRKKTQEDEHEREQNDERRRHAEAERLAKLTPGPEIQLGKGKNPVTEIELFIEERDEYAAKEDAARLRTLFSSQPFTIQDSNWRGSTFFDASHMGGAAVLEYNLDHVFFKRLDELIDSLEEPDEDDELSTREIAREIKILFDLMIISYARSEANFSDDTNLTAGQFVEEMRASWGRFLMSYIRTRNDESI